MKDFVGDNTGGDVRQDVSQTFGLDCGFLGASVRTSRTGCRYGCRPVKNDKGSLIGILFGPDNFLAGDVDELSKAVLKYQITGAPGPKYSKDVLDKLYFGWTDSPSVIPVVSGNSLSSSRESGNYYSGLPSLSDVKGLFFAGSAVINYLIDHNIDLTSSEASGYGLYVPIQSCPALSEDNGRK